MSSENSTKKVETSELAETTPSELSSAEVPGMVRTLKTLLDATIRERLRLETLLDEAKEVSERLETLLDRADQTFESRSEEPIGSGGRGGSSGQMGGFEKKEPLLPPLHVEMRETTLTSVGRRSSGRQTTDATSCGLDPTRRSSEGERGEASWSQRSAGQVESLRARLTAFRRESKSTAGITEPAMELAAEPTVGATRRVSPIGAATETVPVRTTSEMGVGVSRNERMREVETLLRQGMTASEIAAHCRLPIGEVELMSRLLYSFQTKM